MATLGGAPAVAAPLIGVFDSGVGGLSVLAALRTRLPGARFAYLCDNAHFPYGLRTEEDVAACTLAATLRLVERVHPDLVVIACNTASTAALPTLRAHLSVPVVGVVPAVKPAASLSATGTIGLLATPGAVAFPYTDELIRDHAGRCRVLRAGSSALVTLAELKLRGGAVPPAAVRAELAPLFGASPPAAAERMDVVVLGCTHFPLLAAELAAAAPWPVRWLDSGGAVAARVASLLAGRGADVQDRAPPAAPVAYVTRDGADIEALRPALAALGFARVEAL